MNHLINKAKEKGFDEYHSHRYWMEGFEHSDYLWMCLLQKWLRDEHEIHITPYFRSEGNYSAFIFNKKATAAMETINKETYEQALEEALIKSLTLIN